MFCQKCGKELKDGATFCGYCGAPTGQKAESQPQGTAPVWGGGSSQAGTSDFSGNTTTGALSEKGGTGGKKSKIWILIAGAAVAVLAIVIILVVVLFGKSAGNELIGEWTGEYSWSDFMMAAGMGNSEEVLDLSKVQKIEGVLEFQEDGTWEFYIEEQSLKDAIKSYVDAYIDYFKEADDVERYAEVLLEAYNTASDSFLDEFEWSGDYEVDKKTGEIEISIKKAGDEKVSKKASEVVLSYEIKNEKLLLDLEEDEDDLISKLDNLGLFDVKMSKE